MEWVVGYGSLMHPGSLSRTLPRVPERRPVIVDGWQRDFLLNVRYPHDYRCRRCGGSAPAAASADAQPARAGQLAAVAFAVGPADLDRLDAREVSYQRVAVAPDQIRPRLEGQAWIYQGKPEHRTGGAPLADSYAALLQAVAGQHPHGADILEELTSAPQAPLDFDPDPERQPCCCS